MSEKAERVRKIIIGLVFTQIKVYWDAMEMFG